MKDFEFYKTIRISNINKLSKVFLKLEKIYNKIPDTKGCMENIESSCKAWCCIFQTPQFLYSEFLLVWDYISKNWDDDAICDLFEMCMLNAVDKIPSKGCVFFDKKTNMCKIHEKRPLNCRIYGITPNEEFEPRYLRLKEEYKNIIGAFIKPQCDLVSTCDGTKVTVKETSKWWEEITEVEHSIGIPKKMITDEMGGSYRTPHDHILLYNMPENVLNSLAGIKEYKDEFEKKRMIKEIIQVIKNVFQKSKK